MTDADTFRKAAALMRDNADERWHPVGAWLDQHARYHNLPCKLDGCGALAVATAYLGGDQ